METWCRIPESNNGNILCAYIVARFSELARNLKDVDICHCTFWGVNQHLILIPKQQGWFLTGIYSAIDKDWLKTSVDFMISLTWSTTSGMVPESLQAHLTCACSRE